MGWNMRRLFCLLLELHNRLQLQIKNGILLILSLHVHICKLLQSPGIISYNTSHKCCSVSNKIPFFLQGSLHICFGIHGCLLSSQSWSSVQLPFHSLCSYICCCWVHFFFITHSMGRNVTGNQIYLTMFFHLKFFPLIII